MNKKLLVLFFTLLPCAIASSNFEHNAKHRLYHQLDHFYKNVSKIIDDLYSYTYDYDEWRASRFSTVGRIGQAIDRYILFKDPETAARELRGHERECKDLIRELAPILKQTRDYMDKMVVESDEYQKEIKEVVIFLGKKISQVGGIDCMICNNFKKQLDVYDISLKKLNGRFNQNRINDHIPRYFQIYREKFLTLICGGIATAIGILALDKTKWTAEKLSNSFASLKYNLKTSFDSMQIITGAKEDPADETVREMRESLKKHRQGLIEIVRYEGVDVADDILPYELIQKIDYEIYERSRLAKDDFEPVEKNISYSNEKIVDARKSMNESLKHLSDLSIIDGVASGIGIGWGSNRKIVTDLLDSVNNVFNELMLHGSNVSGLYQLEFVRLALIYCVTIEDGVLPLYKSMSGLASWGYAIVPPIIAYYGVKRIVREFLPDHHLNIENCILQIDSILSKYSFANAIFSDKDEGLLMFWLDKLRSEANATTISRDDRVHIVALIEKIKNPSIPVFQKLRALDIQWRFRKSTR